MQSGWDGVKSKSRGTERDSAMGGGGDSEGQVGLKATIAPFSLSGFWQAQNGSAWQRPQKITKRLERTFLLLPEHKDI